MDAEKQVRKLLGSDGTFVRHGRHDVYRIYGIQITITNTRTDTRGWKNNLAEIRRAQRQWLTTTNVNQRNLQIGRGR